MKTYLFKIAKQMRRKRQDVTGEENMLSIDKDKSERRKKKEYFMELLNEQKHFHRHRESKKGDRVVGFEKKSGM